ncbi:MAG: response regulator transcription factor [Methylovulum sp.]|jgi:DNA-binding response OmpR family regulator
MTDTVGVTKRPKMLIVDDNFDMRDLITITFSSSIFDLLEAENGQDALKIIVKEQPDIILLDVMMPGEVDGIDACRIIKTSVYKECCVILLTAKGQKDDFQKGLDAGADAYVTKPFSPVALIEIVNTMWAQKQQAST